MKVRIRNKSVGRAEIPEERKEPIRENFVRPVLDRENHDPFKQIVVAEIVVRVVALAQAMKERQFYPYQVELASRIVESLLEHDGEIVTALLARQSGKTESVGAIVAALVVILPSLAKQFADDWHLNQTDEKGTYRGYAFGFRVGIYAPRLDQSGIMFDRVKQALETDTSKKVLKELGISLEVCNGNTVKLSNGSRVLCESASEQSKIEGETHNLVIGEEAQDISDMKMKKSIHPMIAATGGSIVKIGTATTKLCDFYTAIQQNERTQLVTGKKSHFFFPYQIVQQYNSLYRLHIEKEKLRIGEDSDEFRTSYGCEWIFERGMFVTKNQLFSNDVAMVVGPFSMRYAKGFPRPLKPVQHYSIVAGIDWGSSNDSTVVTLLGVDWNNPVDSGQATNYTGIYSYQYFKKYLLDWLEFIGDNYEYQFHEVIAYLRAVRNLSKITTDSNGCGRPIYDRLTATIGETGVEVEDFNFQAKLKSDGFKSLYGDICGGRLTFPAGEVCRATIQYRKFVNQMLDLRKDYKNQLMQVAAPDEKDAHDDYPCSLMLAAWGANTPTNMGTIEYSHSNLFFS